MPASPIIAGTTPVCVISATGISRPTLATVLAWVVAQFTSIYGDDVSLDSSTMDGQWLGIIASMIDDANGMAVQAYNAFSPSTAQGTGLSSVVKINGIARLVPTYSTAPILVVGVAGTVIIAGLLGDAANYTWALPPSVTIPYSGQITVNATCTTAGAILAPLGTINQISNSQPGWQTASNTAAATPGAPVESDASLRGRQAISTTNSSSGLLASVVGEVAALPGVSACIGYENYTDTPNALGIPGFSIAIVVAGGVIASIANTIYDLKAGAGTYGTTLATIFDANGNPATIAFFVQSPAPISWSVTIKALATYTASIGAEIQAALAAWTSALAGGQSIQINRAYAAAYLNGAADGQTYEITVLSVGRTGGAWGTIDVPLYFWEQATGLPGFVFITVT